MPRIVLFLFGICLFLLCLNTTALGKPRSHSSESEPLNLRDFGAVGDGVADDGPAFQSALDALAAAGGGTLFVPEGKYAIVTPVAKDFNGVASSITIIGVESLTPVAPPSAPGSELSYGSLSAHGRRSGCDLYKRITQSCRQGHRLCWYGHRRHRCSNDIDVVRHRKSSDQTQRVLWIGHDDGRRHRDGCAK